MLVVATAVPATAAPKPPGGVTDNKTFTVVMDGAYTDGSTPAGDADAHITLKITNTAPTQQLGSANVTVFTPYSLSQASVLLGPATATATVVDQTVQLRNLALPPGGGPLSSVTVDLQVDVRTCVSTTPAVFKFEVKQSNDFQGTPGNNFYNQQPDSERRVEVTGPCTLVFASQPADADKTETITSVDFDPVSESRVTVEVRDAANSGTATSSTASITLSAAYGVEEPVSVAVGDPTELATGGFASFTPTIAVSAFGYKFTASSSFTALSPPVFSSSFDIVDEHAACPQGNACEKPVKATNPNNGQVAVATFGTGGTPTNLTVSVGAANATNLFRCDEYAPRPNTFISQFAFTGDAGADRIGTFAITVPNATDPLNSYQVCWASTVQFTTLDGSAASVGGAKPGTGIPGTPLYVGLLPDCPKRVEPTPAQLPCVSNRFFTKQGKIYTANLEIKATGADPWGY
jgi:hypothetical protein